MQVTRYVIKCHCKFTVQKAIGNNINNVNISQKRYIYFGFPKDAAVFEGYKCERCLLFIGLHYLIRRQDRHLNTFKHFAHMFNHYYMHTRLIWTGDLVNDVYCCCCILCDDWIKC